MIEQDIMSRADMVRSPMAPVRVPDPRRSRRSAGPGKRLLQPSDLSVCDLMRSLADGRAGDGQPARRDP